MAAIGKVLKVNGSLTSLDVGYNEIREIRKEASLEFVGNLKELPISSASAIALAPSSPM